MEFLAPWSLAGLVLVPAIFLWGLLAPRGRPVTVGSLVLWRRVLGAGAAGRPSARVRLKDPLLWLDAGVVLLIVLAAAQPAFHTQATVEPVGTVVIDRTAGMAAAGGGPLEFAWQNARDLASGVLKQLDDSPLRVVAAPDATGAVAAEVTTAAELLARGNGPWEPVPVAQDIWPAVLAERAARPELPVLVVTDVASPEPLPSDVHVLATGRAAANAGVVRVAARIEGDRWWLLVAARASAGLAAPRRLVVTGDGQVLADVADFVDPRLAATQRGARSAVEHALLSESRLNVVERVLPMTGPPPRELTVSLTGRADDFPLDDAAYLVLSPAGRLRVLLVGEGGEAVRRALLARGDTDVAEAAAPAASPAAGAETRRAALEDGAAGLRTRRAEFAAGAMPADIDVVVACAADAPAGWSGPAVFIAPPVRVGPVAPAAGQAAAVWQVNPQHPLADALYLEPPQVAALRPYAVEPSAQVLVGTRESPLVVTWNASGGAPQMAVLFGLDEKTTDWPRRASFPVFWSRAADWLVPADRRPAAYKTHAPLEPVPPTNRPAPARPDFYAGPKGERIGVSFIGTDEGFQSGPARDDSAAAVAAFRKSASDRRRATLWPAWPILAAAALAMVIVRAWAAK